MYAQNYIMQYLHIIITSKVKQRYYSCNIIFNTHFNDNILLSNTGFVVPTMKVL